MSKFCNSCIQWEKLAPIDGDAFGVCHDVGVSMNVALDGKTHMEEGGTLWTSAFFGCVYWAENDGSLLSTDDFLNKEDDE